MNFGTVIQDVYQACRPKPWPLQKPKVIQFPVNDICNSQCRMGKIWQQKLDHQIILAELEKAKDIEEKIKGRVDEEVKKHLKVLEYFD